MTLLPAKPGDILAVWTGHSLADDLIRAGEALRGLPAVANHVIVVTHQDKLGRWIGIQGQPGGVGVVDCTHALSSGLTRSNHEQPGRDDAAKVTWFLASCAKSLGISYDWVGIAEDTLNAVHLQDLSAAIDPLWRWPTADGQLPGHVVCSSLAAMLYETTGWAHPDLGAERTCEPSNWWAWSDGQEWNAAAAGRP